MSLSNLPPRPNHPLINVYSIHNALAHNHLIDLLDLHAVNYAFQTDPTHSAVFAHRMRALSAEFRRQVTGAFASRVQLHNVHCIPSAPDSPQPLHTLVARHFEATKQAMLRRHHMIVHPLLLHHRTNVYARVPFLLRADIADTIFDLRLAHSSSSSSSHLAHLYLIVAVKRRAVHTSNRATIRGNSLEKLQKHLYLCNQILHQVQPNSLHLCLLIALHPNRTQPIALGAHPTSPDRTFNSAIWKMAALPLHTLSEPTRLDAINALSWRIDVVDNSTTWLNNALQQIQSESHLPCPNNPIHALLYTTSDPRLRPNMKCAAMYDWPWQKAKKQLAHDLNELTLISGLSKTIAENAMAKRIPNNFAHHQVTPQALGVKSQFTTHALEKSKPHYNGPSVTPQLIPHNKSNWRLLRRFKPTDPQSFDKRHQLLLNSDKRSFYVDFELASAEYLFAHKCTNEQSDVDAHLFQTFNQYFDVHPTNPFYESVIPDALIFMIGCGQLVDGAWKHRVFIADTLDKDGERTVITEWLQHMQSSIPEASGNPLVHVWGSEKQLLRKAFRRMTRNTFEQLQPLRKFELVDMHKVVTTSCVSIKGCFNNSVNNVANALEKLGLLDDSDERESNEQVGNGGDAMAAALFAAEWARSTGASSLSEADVMKDVIRYNEQDCKDIARIANYLRKNH